MIHILITNNMPQFSTPIEQAYISMCDRLDRLVCVMNDPYVKITNEQRTKIKQAAEAIEEEWIIDPSLRAPRTD